MDPWSQIGQGIAGGFYGRQKSQEEQLAEMMRRQQMGAPGMGAGAAAMAGMGANPMMSGAGSAAMAGFNPNPMAYQNANQNAVFNRPGWNPGAGVPWGAMSYGGAPSAPFELPSQNPMALMRLRMLGLI